MAVIAGLHKAILMGAAGNDDYQHLTYARQMLAGDLPLRDFWDISTTLQETVSAVAQVVFGYRLLSEAIVVGIAIAVAVFLVFRVVRTLTGSTWISILCASLFIVAIPRTYAYPKWLVYAMAASLWWSYVWWPSARKAVMAGASVAAAFYWRHDHGLLVAIGVALSMAAAHGWTRDAVRRTAIAASVALLAVLPYLIFGFAVLGPTGVAQLDVASFTDENARTRSYLHWPLQSVADYIGIKPAEWYAPEIIIRWRAAASPEDRAATRQKFGLRHTADEGQDLERVRLSERSLDQLHALVDDPQVADTSRMDRASATFSRAQWPLLDRALFKVSLLRVKLFPGIDRSFEAGMAAAVIMHALPLLAVLLIVLPIGRRLPPAAPPRVLLLFALFTVIVNIGLVREPYSLRSTEALVLPAIVLAVMLATVLRQPLPAAAKWPVWIVTATLLLLTVKSLAVAGEFETRVQWLTGEGQTAKAEATWQRLAANLMASPPSRIREDADLPTARLAEYVRRCVAPHDRVLVLWYAPEIYFEADRLMAGRHVYFYRDLVKVESEQRREVEKVMRSRPPVVLTNSADAAAGKTFPGLVNYVDRNYTPGAAFEADGDRYSILIRRDLPPPAVDKTTGWPCYR
jgi:hypothetical protein